VPNTAGALTNVSQRDARRKPSNSGRQARAVSGGWRRLARILRSAARSDRNLILAVFIVATAVRLVYLAEYRGVPYYDRPFGDSSHYQRRAVEIVSGDLVGRQAYFLGSPLYPYFMAAIYRPFGVSFTLLRVIQILIGGATCVLIYLLARTMARAGPHQSFIAGLLAAGYGTLVFYDSTLLMTTLELFLTSASLLLLVVSQRPGRRPGGAAVAVFLSGALLGLAGLGRPNVLVFAPFGLLWIFWRFGGSFALNRWRYGVLFTLGCILAVSPITIRNYVVSQDFVLVSSSAGVNLFIGNNPEANGFLSVPRGSGLEIWRLYESSREAAQAATGRADMKPSHVSRYWTSEAFRFITQHPGDAARLLLLKLRLFWNHYEIPNLHNKYYIANTYAPSLRWMFVGFGLIAPLALVGILLELKRRPARPSVRLYLGFLLVYMCSVVPFFVTARYRIPVVPLLIVFASAGLWNLFEVARRRHLAWMSAALVLGVVSAVWANRTVAESNFWFSHAIVGMVHTDLAKERPQDAGSHLETAIVELKKAIELSPQSIAPRYYLGDAYRRIGYNSGAIAQFEEILERQPSNGTARDALEEARTAYEKSGGDEVVGSIPLTPLEVAVQYRRQGKIDAAELLYRRVLQEDPQHARAHNDLGVIYADRNELGEAIAHYKKGLRYSPDNPVLLNNVASAYYRAGDIKNARRFWERSLEVNPGDKNVIRQLRALQKR
jgi:tetratricopeptide (TPR) repeat protein